MDNRKQRELKFRAWGGSNMIQPADLFGDVRNELLIALNGSLFYFKEESNGNWAPSTLESFQKPDYKLMQFTGKHDANDIEIYEADIIDDMVGNRYSVEWNDDLLRWQLSDGSPLNDGDNYGKLFVIIGNLYETPDLLTPQPNP